MVEKKQVSNLALAAVGNSASNRRNNKSNSKDFFLGVCFVLYVFERETQPQFSHIKLFIRDSHSEGSFDDELDVVCYV